MITSPVTAWETPIWGELGMNRKIKECRKAALPGEVSKHRGLRGKRVNSQYLRG